MTEQNKEYEYDRFNRTRRVTLRFKEEEYELIREIAFKEKKTINQVVFEKIFKKN